MLLAIRDETPAGESLHELTIEFLTERITVRDLIRERVHHEVREFNRRQTDLSFRGLVQPDETERVLNGARTEYRLKSHRPLDWEKQYERAIEGFSRNGFFVLIGDKQAESLDQEFAIGPTTNVAFIKLVPLIGG